MQTTRCDICKGQKTITGLGCLIKDCPGCKGAGHVKIEQEQPIESAMQSVIEAQSDEQTRARKHDKHRR